MFHIILLSRKTKHSQLRDQSEQEEIGHTLRIN